MITDLIFVYSENDAIYAANHYLSRKNHRVIILAASVYGILELEKVSVPYFHIDKIQIPKSNYFKKEVKPFFQDIDNYLSILDKNTSKLSFKKVSLIKILKIIIGNEFLDVLFTYKIFKYIENKWHPNNYYFNSHLHTEITSWHVQYFSQAAIMADFFCSKKKIKYFKGIPKTKSNHFLEYITYIIKSPLLILKMIIVIFLRIFDKFRKTNYKKSDFVFFSGGLSLFYYHQLFKLFYRKKEIIHFLTLVDWQGIEDEWLLRINGIKFVLISKLFGRNKIEQNINLAHNINLQISKEIDIDKFKEIYKKYLQKKIINAFQYKTISILKKYLNRSINQIIVAEEIINKTKPKLIITTHDPGPSATPYVLVGNLKHIPTLLLQHGLHNLCYYTNYHSNNIAVWGNSYKKELKPRNQLSKTKIYPVGFSYLDKYFINNKTQIINLTDKLRNNPIKVGILLTIYQYDSSVLSSFFTELFTAIKKSSISVVLNIRPHPSQYFEDILYLAKHYKIKCLYNKYLSIEKFIKENDIIYSFDTTAIIWAMIYKKPLFYSSPWWDEGYLPVKKYQAAWVPKNGGDFINKLKEYVQNPEIIRKIISGQERFLKELVGHTDGSATIDTYELIKKLLNK